MENEYTPEKLVLSAIFVPKFFYNGSKFGKVLTKIKFAQFFWDTVYIRWRATLTPSRLTRFVCVCVCVRACVCMKTVLCGEKCAHMMTLIMCVRVCHGHDILVCLLQSCWWSSTWLRLYRPIADWRKDSHELSLVLVPPLSPVGFCLDWDGFVNALWCNQYSHSRTVFHSDN